MWKSESGIGETTLSVTTPKILYFDVTDETQYFNFTGDSFSGGNDTFVKFN